MRAWVLFIFILLCGFKAQSCSCGYEFSEFTPHHLLYYNHIIACKPFSVETRNNQLYYLAVVSKTYWGLKNDTVKLSTSVGSGSCGKPLVLNENYLLYGHGDEIIQISSCSPSRQLPGTIFSSPGNSDMPDSLNITINGIYKKYAFTYLDEYFLKAADLEMKYLEIISNTITGKILTKFSNDSVSAEITLKDGKLNGPSTFYYPDGKIKSNGYFINNSHEGAWTEYTFMSAGQKNFYFSQKGKYINDQKRYKWKGKILIGRKKDFRATFFYNLNSNYH